MRTRKTIPYVALGALLATAGKAAAAEDGIAPIDTETRVTRLVRDLRKKDKPGQRVWYSQRAHAAFALGRLGLAAASAVPDVIVALEDPDSSVRVFAAQALGDIGVKSAEVKGALVARFADESWRVRGLAGRSLVRLGLDEGTKIVETLAEVVEKGDRDGRTYALMTLRDMGPRAGAAAVAIRRQAEGPNPDTISCGVLARLGPGGVKELARLTAANLSKEIREDARSSAAEVIVDALEGKRSDTDELLAIVLTGLDDAEKENRTVALLQLGAIGSRPELGEARSKRVADALDASAARSGEDPSFARLAREFAREIRGSR